MPTVTLASAAPRSVTAIDVPLTTTDLSRLPAATKRLAKLQGFEAKLGQTLVLAGGDGPTEVLVGLGVRREVTADKIRRAGAAYARVVARHRSVASNLAAVAIEAGVDADEAVAAAVEGLRLASYRFTDYRDADNLKSPVNLSRIALVARGRGLRSHLAKADATVDAVELARDLGNTPGGDLIPEEFVRRARRACRGTGVRVTVWDEEKIRRERLGGVLAVNQGSVHPPRLLVLTYRPEGREPKANVALVGKGITFDSGGLSLKTAQGMMSMKIDMAGGAAVLAAMTALRANRVPVAVTGYIPLTDNMTGGDAQRPGDVFRARNGKTVEVLNTDAEGRLILADALALAAESEPDAINIATLTGSASAALGTSYAALMATDDKLAARLETASGRTGEKLWRLPLPAEYRPQLDSTVADLKNIGAGPFGGALVAGLFLKEFAGSGAWAHIDLGMSAISETERGVVVKGATGLGVRVLLDTLINW